MSFCIIVSDGEGLSDKLLHLPQVIESLSFCQSCSSVGVILDLMFYNQRSRPTCAVLAHRGLAVFEKGSEGLPASCPTEETQEGELRPEDVLAGIYEGRIVPRDARSPGFFQRQNCFSCEQKETSVVVFVPEIQVLNSFNSVEDKEARVFPPFTAFGISNIPEGYSWCRVNLRIEGLTYDYLVAQEASFWVDGPSRVMEQIDNEDLPLRGFLQRDAGRIFNERIKGRMLIPKAYDVVIFRPGVQGVDTDTICEPVTGDAWEATIPSDALRQRAHVYVTRSPGFWIDIRYVSANVACSC